MALSSQTRCNSQGCKHWRSALWTIGPVAGQLAAGSGTATFLVEANANSSWAVRLHAATHEDERVGEWTCHAPGHDCMLYADCGFHQRHPYTTSVRLLLQGPDDAQ